MKYFIWVAFLLGGLAVGAVAQDYRFQSEIKSVTSLDWKTMVNAHDNCVRDSHEVCKIYGGFAPLSMFDK